MKAHRQPRLQCAVTLGSCLLVVLTSLSSLEAQDTKIVGSESSPLIIGEWKLVCNTSPCPTPVSNPIVDTEFRFVNPTRLNATLEYAFFENDGTFCGCDRDTFTPNKTTVYTVSGERNSNPSLMTCKGNSGALKSIVFAKHEGDKILIDGATQTGFQTHLFRNITMAADGSTFYADTMAEAGMKGVAITDQTLAEITAIHRACVNFLGPPN